jgi:CheY-like chemotaxis protein
VGIDISVTKPLKQSELLEVLVSALGAPPVRALLPPDLCLPTLTGELQPAPPGALRALLVEDNPVNQKLAVRLLEKRGFVVTVAPNGKEALAVLQTQPFDLVLMDVQMPEMNGFEATMQIRQAEQGTGRHVPILAMTAYAMKGDRERCLEAGMDGYVSKPIQPKELFEAIQRLLQGGTRAADQPPNQNGEPAEQRAAPAPSGKTSN